jgi:uncharacterized protein YcbK (DUF882 family)
MGDLSPHFNRSEFKCRCGKCKQDAVDHGLVVVLERLRVHCEIEREYSFITVTSGNRCFEYNMAIGGSENSQHLWSKAADIQVKGWSSEEIYALLDARYPDTFGIGLYRTWVHIDVRTFKARWDKR